MEKKARYLIVAFLVMAAAGAALYIFTKAPFDIRDEKRFSGEAGPVTMLGPYAKNINLTENIGTYSINIRADTLYMKKGRIMGFSTALHKKFVAENFSMTLYRKGEKKLELYKDRVTLDPFLKAIEVDNPKMLHPSAMGHPGKVSLDKSKKRLVIQFNKKADVWNLEK